MPVAAPAVVKGEFVRPGLRRVKARAIRQRDLHPGVAKGHDIGAAIAVHIGQGADMQIVAPAGLIGELAAEDPRPAKAGAGGQADLHPAIAKADHVVAAVAIDIGHGALVAGNAPAAGLLAHVGQP